MFIGLPTGPRIIIDNETSKTLENLCFYVNGELSPAATVKKIKPADRKQTSIILLSAIPSEDYPGRTYTLEMSIGKNTLKKYVLAPNLNEDLFRGHLLMKHYLLTIKENGNVLKVTFEETDIC